MKYGIPYVVVDVETTGLVAEQEQIIELAAKKVMPDGTTEEFHRMVALEEGKELPSFITELTGITVDDLEGAQSEAEVLKEFEEFAEGCVYIAQNAPFDFSFLARGEIHPEKFYCTRFINRYLEPEKSASLKEVTKRRGISLEGHHRAMNDVEATLAVWKGIPDELRKQGINPFTMANRVLREADRPLAFIPAYSTPEFISKVQLTSRELCLMYNLMEESVMRRRIGYLIDRQSN